MANPTLPTKTDLVGNPSAGTFKTALGQFYDYVSGIVASMIPFMASGNITATNVQAAIQELDSEKLSANGKAVSATTSDTAVKLASAKTITLTGDITGSVSTDFSSDSTINTTGVSVAVKTALNVSGAAPIYPCRVWVNFNGQGVIRGSGNVSSVTKNGTGDYTINFDTPMSDTNYAVLFTTSNDQTSAPLSAVTSEQTIAYVRVVATNNAGTKMDNSYNNVVVYR